MEFSLDERLDRIPWQRIAEWSVLALVAFSILWKGGKSLEATWLLMATAWICTFGYHWQYRMRSSAHIHSLLWLPVVLFVLWTFASYLHSSTANYGLDELLRTGALGLLFFWLIRMVAEQGMDSDFFQKLMKAIALATLVACVIGIVVYTLQPVNRFVGTFFDFRFHTDYWPNAWAEFLLLTWPVVLLWSRGLRSFKFACLQVPSFFVVGFVFGCLFLTYSRGALIAFSGQLALLALFTWLGNKDMAFWKQTAIKVLAVGLVALGFFFTINGIRSRVYDVQSVQEKVTFTADEGGSSVSERAQFWEQALLLSREKPILGWGPYSFRFIQPRLQTTVFATSDHPHNVLLKLAVESGWPAALFFGCLVGLILVSFVTRYSSLVPRPSIGQFYIFLGVVGVLAHNLIDYNLQFVGIALPFWIFLGILGSTIQIREPIKLSSKFVQVMEIGLVTILMAFAIVEGSFLILSSIGRHVEAAGHPEAALAWYDRAKHERFSRDLHLSRAHILIGLQRYEEAQRATDDYLSVNTQDYRGAKARGENSFRRHDYAEAYDMLSAAYVGGRWNDIGISHLMVQTLLASERTDELAALRPEIDQQLDSFAAAIQLNAHFIALGPQVEELIALANLLAEHYPDDAPKYQVLAAKADFAARQEREKIAARAPGYLW